MGVYAKATPLRMLGVAVLVTATLVLFGGGTAKAKDLDGDYTLTNDITEQIRIVENKKVVLNLNGCDITTTGEDAIVVEKGATLTVVGSGTVEAIGNGFAALYNNGDSILNGGTYVKDESKGTYYTILNHGNLAVYDGVVVRMVAPASGNPGSSLVDNGYSGFTNSNDPRKGYNPDVNNEFPKMNVYGGFFDGGMNTIKNDGNGILTVNDGYFTNNYQVSIMNYNETTINGGIFDVPTGGDKTTLFAGGSGSDTTNRGIIQINGGTFNADNLLEAIRDSEGGDYSQYRIIEPVKITGGVFNIKNMYSPDRAPETFSETIVTGGTFADGVELPALPDGYFKYDVVDPATKEPVSIVTDEEVVFDDEPIDYTMKVGDKYVMDLPELVLQYGVFNNFVGGLDGTDGGSVELDGNSVVATSAGHAAVTVSFNGKTRTYNFVIADAVTDVPDVTPPVSTDENTDIAAPNTGIATDATSGAADGASILATITTALAMLVVLAGIRIAAKEND